MLVPDFRKPVTFTCGRVEPLVTMIDAVIAKVAEIPDDSDRASDPAPARLRRGALKF